MVESFVDRIVVVEEEVVSVVVDIEVVLVANFVVSEKSSCLQMMPNSSQPSSNHGKRYHVID